MAYVTYNSDVSIEWKACNSGATCGTGGRSLYFDWETPFYNSVDNSWKFDDSSWKRRPIRYVETSAWNSDTCTDYPTACWQPRWDWPERHQPKPEDRLKQIIQQRQAPAFIQSRKHLNVPTDIREIRARETLLRVLGEQKFRSFVKNGFISVRAKSGLVYQIFPGSGMTNVYRDGKAIEKLCVVLNGSFPPTDSLIMRYLLILNDERDFRKHAINHTVHQKSAREIRIDQRPLTEIFKELKVA